jgi:uncharacterized protein YegL
MMVRTDEQDSAVHPRDDNPEARCPCVLLLDTSGSMEGDSIRELTAGLEACRAELLKDELSSLRVELAVVTFGSEVTVAQTPVSPEEFRPPALEAGGRTPMGAGIHKALDLMEERIRHYRAHDLDNYTPWIILVTDGKSTDPPEVMESAASRIRAWEKEKRVAFFAVGVENADLHALARIAVRRPLKLRGLKFASLFRWVSKSLAQVSKSRLGDRVVLPNPLLEGWAEV